MSELMLIWIRMEEFLHSTFLDVEIWRIIVAGLIIIFTLTIRKILVNLLIAVLKRITAKTKTELDDQLVNAIEPPARLIVITAGILIAVRVLGLETAGDSFLGRFIRSMFIFSVFWAVYRAAGVFSGLFERFSSKTSTRLDDLLVPFINKGIKVIVVIIGISVIASEWEYDLGAFLAGLGLGGLAFALAAQETLANFFGGLTIMVDKPFAIGDWITCSGVEGLVEDIGFRSTKVRTAEQALVNVPNSIIAKAAVTNWSRRGKRRIRFHLHIKYQATAEQIEALLEKVRNMLTTHPEIHQDTIFVFLDTFGTNAYELLLNFFTKTTNFKRYLEVKEDVNLKLIHILDELNIEIAYPSTAVYLENMKNAADESKDGQLPGQNK